MIDIETIKDIIKRFAEKNGFLQDNDIDTVEIEEFNRNNYKKIDGKPFVSINKTEILFGKINIEIDEIEEEEWYWIDKDISFVITISDIENEDSFIEEITEKCKKNDLCD
jgi:hypothetical protein